MSRTRGGTEGADAAQALIEELLHTAFSLGEMLAGSSRPVIDAAGEADCRVATALIGAIRDRVLDDLRAAARLARLQGN